MKIDDYFASLERGLRQNPLVSHLQEPFTLLASDDYNGIVRGRAFFWDDSFLDLYEVVSTELGYPVRIHYAYTYLQREQRVFRYTPRTILPCSRFLITSTLDRKIAWRRPINPA